MDHEIVHRPSFALLRLALAAGESVRAEAGAMVDHDDGIEVSTAATGGVVDSLKRSVLGDESVFQNTFTAERAGEVSLAPPLPGDVERHDLDGDRLLVQSGSYLASEPSIDLDTRFGGGRTFFGGEGLFLLELAGSGPVFVSSYGAIERIDLGADEHHTVDTGHVVAFEGSTEFDVRRVGGLKSTLLSGEGLVCRFTGPGSVWIQTRSTDALLAWLIPNLPSNSGSGG
jgi:uncharacterized protein (TIGR00266 family)